MRKWAVIYSSVTGNTKAVAAAMAEEAGADLFRVQDAPADLSAYEAVALGYWLRRGGPDDLMKAYLPRVENARVALFQTHGADVGSEHAVTSFARAGYLLGAGCEILGTFSAQGKLAPALIEKRKRGAKDDSHNSPEAQERWVRAANHPDADDLAAARTFVQKMEHKMDLLEKFRRAQEARKAKS
ncbi:MULTISPECIES: flavodoxin family protein [Selenomonas]|uniref:flavodoxin family protein n=1 Tax=Selenomonas TaxID=970 RepID=UPI0001EB318C|nr:MULTISPECIES: flavodoxin family protein [Selenomonas]EFR39731.1 flavodoxin family protein [Selenomonas sp. oral taxon 137 str. F0430]